MADLNKKTNPETPDDAVDEVAAAEKALKEADAALDSFLSREQKERRQRRSANKKFNRNMIILLSAVIVIAVLTGVIIAVNNQPYPQSTEEGYVEARTVATVDEAGVHEVVVPTTAKGEPMQNGGGTLLDYTPSDLVSVEVTNKHGSFTVLAQNHDGEATEYTLVGYEPFLLRAGGPDAVANDACDLVFNTIAGTGKDLSAFGLDKPRAVVSVTYNDGTKAHIRVGNNAAASAGTYIAFGNGTDVYLVTEDAVDSFFYAPADFISLTVTDSISSAEAAAFSKLSISGSHYPQKIMLEKNTDPAIDYDYRMTAPHVMFTDPVTSSDIAGSIRDLYAEKVVAVNPGDKNTAAFLAPYGLGLGSYAEIVAEYPDATIRLRCSEPDEEGNVYLVNASDEHTTERVVYQMQLAALSWATTTVDMLMPDTVLRVNRDAVGNITVTGEGKTYSIDADTKTQTVETTDGETEEVTTTEAYMDGKRLDSDGFIIFLQNLTNMPNTGGGTVSAGKKLLEIRYTYTTGREPDVIIVYDSDSQVAPVALNGSIIGSTTKYYVSSLLDNLEDLQKGVLPENL